MLQKYLLMCLVILLSSYNVYSQENIEAQPVLMGSSKAVPSQPLSSKELVPPIEEFKIYNPRNRGSNKIVPGKGYPKTKDAAWQKEPGEITGKKPILNFTAATSNSTPTDPTGAVGPNHYVNAWNSAFSIYDKEGNQVSPPADLSSLGGTFQGEDLGDPIVFYDEFADRFVISQFSDTPNSLLVAVSQGPDPVNDGWYTYRFETGSLPDYPKFFVWSDGYYVTTNKNPLSPDTSEVVFVLEREKMLVGEEAQQLAFPLPGIRNNGFYSPAGFFALGDELPPEGNAPIMYFQDDAWVGVNEDHLKIWLINVDWGNPGSSSIAESQRLGGADGVTPFHSTFDGGSFINLSQPGEYPDVDALQGAIMYMTPYRRFPTHNSVVLNFVVDIDPSPAEHAGIRWYELRQNPEGGPWRVHQEGTYAPDDSDRWCGSIGMDRNGNIAMGFTVMNDNEKEPIFPSLRYTGRFDGDPSGRMTVREVSIIEGPSPNPSNRYGDYAHLTIDPVDGQTFWYNGEYFVNQSRRNRVAVFKVEPDELNDVGIVDIVSPRSETLGSDEEVTVAIRNFGLNSQTDIPVTFSVNGGPGFTEVYTGTIPRTSEVEFTFSNTVDLSQIGQTYTVTARTDLPGDEDPENDEFSTEVRNLEPRDVGITTIDAPVTGLFLNSIQNVTVTIQNFGGEPQSNIPVSYAIDGGTRINEVYEGTVEVGEQVSYTFQAQADISSPGVYRFFATTNLPQDADTSNDSAESIIANLNCIPEGSDCSFGDGISDFYLEDIRNENIPCSTGYIDFIGFSTELDRTVGTYVVGVASRYASEEDEKFSMWIDFNDNGSFDDDEMVIDSEVIPSQNEVHSFEFSIPANAPLGEHILRIRAGDTSYEGDLNDPCSVMDYGTTHDYSVVITDSTISIDDSILNEAELIVINRGDRLFDISMETTYRDPLRITVHNLLGQKLVENKIEKDFRGYNYELDMSYVASGVYLIRVGTRKVGKVKRILVQ